MSTRDTRRRLPYCVVAITLLAMLAAGAPAHALEGEHNRLPELCQGLNGAAYETNGLLVYLFPTPQDLVPFAAAYGANWNLKLCPPQILAPPTVKAAPDPDNRCHRTFRQRLTKTVYRNIEGVPFDAPNWGELGSPQVYHFNTDSEVRILDREITDPFHDERDLEGSGDDTFLTLPVGYNRLKYRADSLVSVIDFVPLYWPKRKPGGRLEREAVRRSPSLARLLSREAARFLTTKRALFKARAANALFNAPSDSSSWMMFRHSELGLLDDVYNEDVQDVWVFDRSAPSLSASTDLAGLPARTRAVMDYDTSTQTYFIEAIQPGGIRATDARNFLEQTLSYSDECDREVTLRGDIGAQNFWTTGSEHMLTWTASDPGPVDENGGRNTTMLTQRVRVRDSHPPVLLAPPGFVYEVLAGQSSVVLPLGSPRAYDLANPSPQISNDLGATNGTFGVGLHEVTWRASDGVNESQAVQLVNVKIEGTNRAPVAHAQSVDARSYEEVEITLTGQDPDINQPGNRRDPLSFNIVELPQNGFFVAPLLPYFIDDVRLEAGAAGLTDAWQTDPEAYCRNRAIPPDYVGSDGPNQWQMGYPYNPSWMAVNDSGMTIVEDRGDLRCDENHDAIQRRRLVIFNEEQDILATRSTPTGSVVTDIYWHAPTDEIYLSTNAGDHDYVYVYDSTLTQVARYNITRVPSGSTPDLSGQTENPVALTVGPDGTLYVAGSGMRGVRAYRRIRPEDPLQDIFLEDSFLGLAFAVTDTPVSDDQVQSIAMNSAGELLVGMSDRIHQVGAAGIDGDGQFQAGEVVGWMGRCSGNLTNTYACDVPNGISIGFSCTELLCARAQGISGDRPGQFNSAMGIAVDPNDILYVSDFGNRRVQRFTSDGFFAGQAKSVGEGYGFLLSDFAPPSDIEVNSNHFYILDTEASLLHIFETTPIEPIDDASARVVYRSNDNFVGTDQFRFAAFDGLASGTATVTLNVGRNFRPPSIPNAEVPFVAPSGTEDVPLTFTLNGSDPDGSHDTLSVVLVTPPVNGSVQFNGLVATYTPRAHFHGADSFVYRLFDGRDQSSEAALVNLSIASVEDTPIIEVEAQQEASAGFLVQHRVDVFDPDENEVLRVEIDWGDGTQTVEGHFTLDGNPVAWQETRNEDGTLRDGVDVTGPILSLAPDGRGVLIAAHVFAQPGTYLVRSCVIDKAQLDPATQQKIATGASKSACATTEVTAILAAELTLDTSAPAGELQRGDDAEFTVTLANRRFDLEPGDPGYENLPATGTDITALALTGAVAVGLDLLSVSTTSGTCTVSGTGFRCDVPSLVFDTGLTLRVQTRVAQRAAGRSTLAFDVRAEATQLREPAQGTATVQVAAFGAAPNATAVNPARGAPTGYEPVTITGDNFEAGAQVYLGANTAIDVAVVDAETITATTLAHTEGLVDVRVVNPDDLSVTLTDGYRYGDEPPAPPAPVPTPPPPPTTSGGGNGSSGGGGSHGLLWQALLLALWLVQLSIATRRRRST